MDRQQEVRDFLDARIKEKGLSLNSLSLRLGKNPTYLFHFIKRHSPRRLDETARRQLAQILDVPEQSLCDFQIPSGVIQDKLSTLTNLFGFGRQKTDDLVALDVIDMDGARKGRFEAVKTNLIGQEMMSKDVFAAYSKANPETIKILKVSGDAMSPNINSGDIVWLDTSYVSPASDGIYLLNTAGDCLIRRIQINPFDSSVEVSADNNAYKSFKMTNIKELEVCGKIVFAAHRLV